MTGRVDGPDKVTGRARYAFEHPVDGAAYVWAVPSVIAKGLIRSVDASAALALPGVLAVITPDNAPRLPGRPAIRSSPCSSPGLSPTAGSSWPRWWRTRSRRRGRRPARSGSSTSRRHTT